MTLAKAIELTDSLCPNQYEQAEKILWLSELDGRIFNEVVQTHERENGVDTGFEGYGPGIPTDTELLVPYPYDGIYSCYLEMKINDANAEITKYNNSAVKFNTMYKAYSDHYTRTHMPLQRGSGFYF